MDSPVGITQSNVLGSGTCIPNSLEVETYGHAPHTWTKRYRHITLQATLM